MFPQLVLAGNEPVKQRLEAVEYTDIKSGVLTFSEFNETPLEENIKYFHQNFWLSINHAHNTFGNLDVLVKVL
jgi:hypothetical protein